MKNDLEELLKAKELVLENNELPYAERILHERSYNSYLVSLYDTKDTLAIEQHVAWFTNYLEKRGQL